MIIAHLSDFHLRLDGRLIKDRVDSRAALEAGLASLGRLRPSPDVVLITGDLVQRGRSADYPWLAERLDGVGLPVFVVPGNHDQRQALRAAFLDRGASYLPRHGEFLHYVVEDFPLRLIGLDTQVEGEDWGALCVERLGWLEVRLSEAPERPTALFLHHPPFPSAIAFIDSMPFRNGSGLAALLHRHPQVEALFCGHTHRRMTTQFVGALASVAPSLVFQMSLDLTPGAVSSFVLEPPGFCLYAWDSEHGLVAHAGMIGDYGPRHPFHVDRTES